MVDKFLTKVFGPIGRLLYKHFFIWMSPDSSLGAGTGGVLMVLFLLTIIGSLILGVKLIDDYLRLKISVDISPILLYN